MIRVQTEDFDVGAEYTRLCRDRTDIGGVCLFVGRVRDLAQGASGDAPLSAMTLEHYPAMTEKELAAIEAEARQRWQLDDTLIIHRHGRLTPGDQIVLVATVAAHRDPAFEACRFLIDWLKTRAPFWKKEEGAGGGRWVEAKASDHRAAARWNADEDSGD